MDDRCVGTCAGYMIARKRLLVITKQSSLDQSYNDSKKKFTFMTLPKKTLCSCGESCIHRDCRVCAHLVSVSVEFPGKKVGQLVAYQTATFRIGSTTQMTSRVGFGRVLCVSQRDNHQGTRSVSTGSGTASWRSHLEVLFFEKCCIDRFLHTMKAP
jgi:hypothetical protein